jgi:hypothetical protein
MFLFDENYIIMKLNNIAYKSVTLYDNLLKDKKIIFKQNNGKIGVYR